MLFLIQKYNNIRVKLREYMNKYLGPFRLKKIERTDFSIISNNCWGGHVYRYFNHAYTSPTVGLYFYSEDYIKFIYNLKYYLDIDLSFIRYTESKWKDDLVKHNNTSCPIGKLDDIEVIFLHYKTCEEALTKWNRRKKRIVWDNIVYKFSEQNLCTFDLLKQFDAFPADKKIALVTRDYGLQCQLLWKGKCEPGNIPNDTLDFRKNIDLISLINGDYNSIP